MLRFERLGIRLSRGGCGSFCLLHASSTSPRLSTYCSALLCALLPFHFSCSSAHRLTLGGTHVRRTAVGCSNMPRGFRLLKLWTATSRTAATWSRMLHCLCLPFLRRRFVFFLFFLRTACDRRECKPPD